MKVLVTGASGFFGSHIAERLAAEGHDVRLLLRPTSSRRFLDFRYEAALGDVTEPAALPAAVSGVDAVVHAAGLVTARNEAEFRRVNEGGTANLLAAVEQENPGLARFVYISSLAAHGPSPDGRPRPADAPPRPVSAYGRSKLAGEERVRRSALAVRAVIIRPPVIYGPRDPALLPFFRLARLRVAPLLMGGRNCVSVVYAEDAARAVAACLAPDAPVGGKTYTIDDGEVHSWRDLLAAVEAAVGRRALRLPAPRWSFTAGALLSEAASRLAGRPALLTRDKVREMAQGYWVCDHAALAQDVGWAPTVDIHEGARRTAAWYREQGWL